MRGNAADRENIERRDEELKRKRLQELDDIRKIIHTPEGERFFGRMLAIGQMFRTTFTGNSFGMFKEGHRNFAVMLFHDMCEAVPELIPPFLRHPAEEIKDGK